MWYVYTVPAGLLLGTVVGVVIGRGGGDRPSASSDALDLGRPNAHPVPFRIAATVTF